MTHHVGSHQWYPKTCMLASPFHPNHFHPKQLPSPQLEQQLLSKSSLVAPSWMRVWAQPTSNSNPLPPPARTPHTPEQHGVEVFDQLEAPGEPTPVCRPPVHLLVSPQRPTSVQGPASKSRGPGSPPSAPKLWTPTSSKGESSQARHESLCQFGPPSGTSEVMSFLHHHPAGTPQRACRGWQPWTRCELPQCHAEELQGGCSATSQSPAVPTSCTLGPPPPAASTSSAPAE